ncbi:MAG TPA: thermonuclease family protein [Halothiobacillus sp.]|jgi:endonuclease YncB( thermonuclease family)|nr:thermonuclease family protein [Halothiobacillus sp.]HQS29449.1 thermonuclease family protein [Halothiobacillus sp.]
MPLHLKTPRLLWRGVFFLWAVLLAGAPSWADSLKACPAPHNATAAVVGYVDDGDTLRLTTGERVRLAGIDAPEVAHPAYNDKKAAPAEPFGDASKQTLQALLARSHNRLLVRYGAEPDDRYGRKIAYVYLPDGQSIQANLVARGLAMVVYMPPNTALADCLTAIEANARQQRLGIWSNAEYEPGIDTARGIPTDVQGAAIVRGRVVSVHQTPKTVWVNLEGRVALQIPARAMSEFHGVNFAAWQGKTLRARGWLVPDKSRYQDWRMPIQSPRSIEVLGR